jgi:rhodanese-related sulfurtransferase
MDLKIFQLLDHINNRLSNIEKNIARIDEKLDFSITLQRNHLIRIKNGHEIDDSMILLGRPYNDLSPQRAFQIYNDRDMDFLLLDVTSNTFDSEERLAMSVHIALEDLESRYSEIASKTTPIMIISEKGLRSIQACEILVRKGYFNLNNISGGHQFWPGKLKKRGSAGLQS